MSAAYRPPCDEGVIRSGPAVAPSDGQTDRWVLAATILGTSMAFIDGTAVQQAIAESFVVGFRVVVLVAAGLAVAGATSAALLIQPKDSGSREQGVALLLRPVDEAEEF